MHASAQRGETNGLGIAGFVVSIVGFCGTGGLLCPLGLILSLVALGRRPRGFAIAGTIIGALGSCGILLALIVIPAALAVVLAAAGLTAAAAGLAAVAGPQAEAQVEMFVAYTNIEKHIHEEQGVIPASPETALAPLDESQRTDPWGTPYGYQVTQEGSAYRLFSAGPDKTAGTPDDIPFQWKVEVNNRKSHLDPTPPEAAAPAPPSEEPTSDPAPPAPNATPPSS